jgi:CelD/BcsL family acetyltransferase involved in cellulose biosynthesis
MRSGNGDLRVTSPVPRAVWESLLRSDKGAAATQSLAWRDAVFATGRYQDVSLLYEFASGRQVVLPLARHRRQPPQAAVVTSWPREWSSGGPISQDGRVSPAEAAAVLADVARRGTLAAQIRLRYNADGNWLSQASRFRVEPYGCYVLDLEGGFDHVWQHKFRGDARTAVRKAERSGLDVEVDRSGGLLGVFCDLYEKSIRDRAARQHDPLWLTRLRMNRGAPASPPQLKLVADHFGKDCATWVARSKGQPVAALITLRFGTHAHGWRVALDKELAHPVRASEYLHRLDIEEACRDGYHFYNMGGAPAGSTLARYKDKLGATMHFTHELYAEHLPVRAARTARRFSGDLVKKTLRLQGET